MNAKPSIVFIDEIDAIGPVDRGGHGDGPSQNEQSNRCQS